jgi:hypothetical protein
LRRRAAGGRAALALAALLACAGCRTPLPALAPLPAGDARPEALLRGLVVLAAERSSLRAAARVSIEGERRASFARQLLLIERPARLRLEVMGVLGQRVAVLATDGSHYDLYRAERPAIETGEVHPGILWEVGGLPLTPEEAVQLALGAPVAPSEHPSVAGSAALPEGGVRVELGYRAGDVRRTLDFDAAGDLRRYAAWDPAGALLTEARYGDYRDLGGSRFAYEIAVELPAAESRAEIRFQWVELNPQLSDELFRLPKRSPASGAPWPRSAS